MLHGYDEAATKKRRGEFATLHAHEANLRVMAADRVLEHLGLRTRLFAAPGWVVSPGVVKALPGNGFRLLADYHGISDLVRKTTVRTRVLGIGRASSPNRGGAGWWCCQPTESPGGRCRSHRGVSPSAAQAGTAPSHVGCHRSGADVPLRTDGLQLAPRWCGARRRIVAQAHRQALNALQLITSAGAPPTTRWQPQQSASQRDPDQTCSPPASPSGLGTSASNSPDNAITNAGTMSVVAAVTPALVRAKAYAHVVNAMALGPARGTQATRDRRRRPGSVPGPLPAEMAASR